VVVVVVMARAHPREAEVVAAAVAAGCCATTNPSQACHCHAAPGGAKWYSGRAERAPTTPLQVAVGTTRLPPLLAGSSGGCIKTCRQPRPHKRLWRRLRAPANESWVEPCQCACAGVERCVGCHVCVCFLCVRACVRACVRVCVGGCMFLFASILAASGVAHQQCKHDVHAP